MNNEDRKKINEISNLINQALEMITELSESHQERIDNMAENLQGSERYQIMEEKQSSLDNIRDSLESLESDIQEAIE